MASCHLISYGLAYLSFFVANSASAPSSHLSFEAGPSASIPNILARRALAMRMESPRPFEPASSEYQRLTRVPNTNHFPDANDLSFSKIDKPESSPAQPTPRGPYRASRETGPRESFLITKHQDGPVWWEDHLARWSEQNLDWNFLQKVGDILEMDKLQPNFDGKVKAQQLIDFLSDYRVISPHNPPIWHLDDIHKDTEGLTAVQRISQIITECGRVELGDYGIPKVGLSAKLTWLLDGLDPNEMVKYAEALREVNSGDVQKVLQYQPILERSDIIDKDEKFSVPRWYSERMGWENFKNCMMASEVKTLNDPVLKRGHSYRKMRSFSFPKDLPKQGLSLPNRRGSAQSQEGVSAQLLTWLKEFRNWLDHQQLPPYSRVKPKQLEKFSRMHSH